MNIECIRLQAQNRLINDYHSKSQTSPFMHSLFSYNPWKEKSYITRYEYLQSTRTEPFDRQQLIAAIRSQYGKQLLHENVELNLERLLDQRSCVVIGGQQAGLLTGPLYTIHKAITIIQLAKREEAHLGVPVIPVFWIAGEDHDFAEVNHIWMRDLQGNVSKQAYLANSSGSERMAISDIPVDENQMLAWLTDVSDQLPDTVYKAEWLDVCKSLIAQSTTWSHFFALFMQMLFDQFGLLLIDSTNVQLRKLESQFFVRLIEQNTQLQQLSKESAAKVRNHEYDLSVDLADGQANLFITVAGERLPLFFEADTWFTRDGVHRWTTEQMIQIAQESPELLSNNVITRPLMQEYLFPTLSFVGGPGEIAYWSMLNDLFTAASLQMPIVYPRLQITLVDQTAWKRMQAFDLSWEDVFLRFAEKKEAWLADQSRIALDPLFAESRQELDQLYRNLVQKLTPVLGKHIADIGETNQRKSEEQLNYLHRYAKWMVEERYEHELRRFDEIATRLLPRQKPQERVYNLIQIWNTSGLDWLTQLTLQPLLSESGEQIMVRI